MKPLFEPPLVSIVISNFNYGRFLRQAVDSVRAQTYPHVECVIVDDCSTDDSAAVLDGLERDHPEIVCRRMETNRGQSAAVLEGYALAKGAYVLFLDADDVLMPDCVACHLAVHMSSRHAVGFTCCDSLQIVDERIAVARTAGISCSFLHLPRTPDLVSNTAVERLAAAGIRLPSVAADGLRHVPSSHTEWAWSTTSCMVFRRDVLDVVCGARGLREMRINTDNYLAHVANLLTGSVIIDQQLVGYRLHGANGFAKRATLDGFSLAGRQSERHFVATLTIFIEDLIERFETFHTLIDDPGRLARICGLIGFWLADLDPDDDAKKSVLVRRLSESRAALEPVAGRKLLDAMIASAAAADPFVDTATGDDPKDGVRLSPSSVHDIAMEVWFERQRWQLPYKIGKWVASRRRTTTDRRPI